MGRHPLTLLKIASHFSLANLFLLVAIQAGCLGAADPPEDDDPDILELLVDVLNSNDALLRHYKAAYDITHLDLTVAEPTQKTAKAVGGRARISYEVRPKTETTLAIHVNGKGFRSEIKDQTGRLVEVVRMDPERKAWEFYLPQSKLLEIMTPDDLPGRLPIVPTDLWMQKIGHSPVNYLASLVSNASKTLRFDENENVLLITSQSYKDPDAGDDITHTSMILFKKQYGLMPSLMAFGYNGILSSFMKVQYTTLTNDGHLASQVDIYYANKDVPIPKAISILEASPPAHSQQISYRLTNIEEVNQAISPIEAVPGTTVKDAIRATAYSTPDPTSNPFPADDQPRRINLLLINGAIIGVVLLVLAFSHRMRRRA